MPPDACIRRASLISSPAMHAPLHGLRVLELARILAGPWTGQVLADLGADVVKVERPGSGDDTRGWGPPFVAARAAAIFPSSYFHACNRGKRSVTADLETEEGRALVKRLASHADVVIENFKVGGLQRYGLDHASLRSRKSAPRLLLDHRLRPGRPLCAARRLRLHRAGPRRHHGSDRRARRRAAEDRRRLRRHLHRRLFRGRDPRGASAPRRDRGGRAISTWRCSTRRSACSPTRR